MKTYHRRALFALTGVALFTTAATAQPANDDCSAPTALSVGANAGNTTGATGTDISSCAFQDALDVWFTYTAPNAGNYTFDTLGTTVDTVLAAFDACGGSQLACDDDGAGYPASRIALALTQNQVALIRLAGYSNSVGAFILNVRAPAAPPANDACGSAAAVSLPFAYSQDISGAAADVDVTCNDATATEAQSGVWFSYTPAQDQLVRFAETSGVNVVITIFSGACDGLSEVRCSDPEDFVQNLTGGTSYRILVSGYGATPLATGSVVNFSMTEVQAPTNDTCSTARLIAGSPYSDSVDGSTAANDADVSCNATANTEARNGVWYRFNTADPGRIVLNETSTNDTVLSIFTGACDGLTEVFCSDAEAPAPAFDAAANTTYYILVSMWSTTTVPAAPYGLTVTYTPTTGSCCIGGNCTLTTQSGCTGMWGGANTNCGGPSVFNIVSSSATFEDISTTGTFLATVSNQDDGGEVVVLPFTFNYLGTDFNEVWVCSNGFIQFGTAHTTAYTNIAIPNTGAPNNFVAPLWDDFDLRDINGTGAVYSLADATHVVISWQNAGQYNAGNPTTDLNNFQVVLFAGSNNIEFRYGTITPENTAPSTGAGDFTIGYEDATGATGSSVSGASLDGGSTARALTHASPCQAGGETGACCSGSSCSATTAAACTGANTSFAGTGTTCNASGNNTSPCCKGDYNHIGGVTVQDIFDFLNGYFTQNAQADVNGAGGVTVQDIFDYLILYFAGPC
jgi:hypothetical protein